ncbi:MAG TPA: chemotaxis protein CheA [Nevskiaceae bacterium]|nr:chemotaxis protein CheA [Nevskiaceae bacterium]
MAIDSQEDIRADFLIEAGEIVQKLGSQLVELEQRPADRDLLNAIFRGFHTIKGGAGFLKLDGMVELCHIAEEVFNAMRNGKIAADASRIDAVMKAVSVLEESMQALTDNQSPPSPTPDLLQALRNAAQDKPGAQSNTITEDEFEALLDELHGPGKTPKKVEEPVAAAPAPPPKSAPASPSTPVAETTVRVDTARLDRVMNLVGELVLVRNRMKLRRGKSRDEELDRMVGQLDQVTSGLQITAMQLRMQPVGKVFSRFPKLARDVARSLGKKVTLTLSGEDTDLDKNLVEALADPLVHLVRNAIDHGIESPEVRAKRGKPAEGHVALTAAQEGDHIVITVRDDGAGMDPEVLRRKAVEKGVLTRDAAAKLTPNQCLELIFAAGFSTKSEVSDISGRGVGMDVVRSKITDLKGSVTIDSAPGVGSTIRIAVPLTLAILPALMVRCGKRAYAIALGAVQDVFALDAAKVVRVEGRPALPRAGSVLRLVFLDRWLGLPEMREAPVQPLVVHVQTEGRAFGLVVDEVLGREEIVVKPLGAMLQGVPGYSGATVTGDGAVALILDMSGVLKSSV